MTWEKKRKEGKVVVFKDMHRSRDSKQQEKELCAII